MTGAALRTICKWCEVKGVLTVLHEGEEPTSHGICQPCMVIFRKENGLRPAATEG